MAVKKKRVVRKKRVVKKKRTPAQIRATKKLVAANKKRAAAKRRITKKRTVKKKTARRKSRTGRRRITTNRNINFIVAVLLKDGAIGYLTTGKKVDTLKSKAYNFKIINDAKTAANNIKGSNVALIGVFDSKDTAKYIRDTLIKNV